MVLNTYTPPLAECFPLSLHPGPNDLDLMSVMMSRLTQLEKQVHLQTRQIVDKVIAPNHSLTDILIISIWRCIPYLQHFVCVYLYNLFIRNNVDTIEYRSFNKNRNNW